MLERHRVKDHRGHHPWRLLGLYPEWKVKYVDHLEPDTRGLTLHREQRILLRDDLDEAGRRSTLCHETGHVYRGPFASAHELYEEALVERQAGRLLLPSIRRISRTLAWHGADYTRTAFDLWVDEKLLNARLSTLQPKERVHLDEQFATIFV